MVIGGNNAITRPGVHSIDPSLDRVGLITIDTHFDLRDTAGGLLNGNPIQALLDDGLKGQNIIQIGIAPFANAAYMHRAAIDAGITVHTMAMCKQRGIGKIMTEALDQLAAHCDRIYVDFDIDAIERGLSPGAPGGRPGALTTAEFFDAARLVGAHRKVACVDLCEFDPDLDVSDITALIAARWFAEILAGFQQRT